MRLIIRVIDPDHIILPIPIKVRGNNTTILTTIRVRIHNLRPKGPIHKHRLDHHPIKNTNHHNLRKPIPTKICRDTHERVIDTRDIHKLAIIHINEPTLRLCSDHKQLINAIGIKVTREHMQRLLLSFKL